MNVINMQKHSKVILPVAIAIVLGVFLLGSSTYVVQEGRQAIITQFGRPIGNAVDTAGLKWKLPFLQRVRMLDKRILSWDGEPNQIPTKDKKYIWVDTTARWRIDDPLKFIQTVQDQTGAVFRLKAIIDAATREMISNYNLVDAVRDSNAIIETATRIRKEQEERRQKGIVTEDDEITGEIEKVEIGREKLSERVMERARKELGPLGIELIDVQIRRIAYEKSVEAKVYARMISERQRIAEKTRSIGKGEKAKIEGKTKRDLQRIQSEAYKQVQQIKGKGESAAIAIYASAFRKDPGFFEFVRTLEAYEKGLNDKTQFILSTDSAFLKVLRKGRL